MSNVLVSLDNLTAILTAVRADLITKINYVGLTDDDKLKISEIDTMNSQITQLQSDLNGMNVINFTNANDAKIKIINAIGDTSLANTSTFTQISNALLTKKQQIVDALAVKGITAIRADDISSYASDINSIVQNQTVKNTKLNKTAGSTYNIVLTNPATLDDICTSVIEYIPGPAGVVKYNCDFNNADSTGFDTTTNQHISFNGTMNQDNNSETLALTANGAVDIYNVYSATVDKSVFHTLDSMNYGTTSVTFNGTYFPTLVQANTDIDLRDVQDVTSLAWTATTSGTSVLLIVYSIDSGITWKGYDLTNHVPVNISDITNLTEVKSKAITITNANSLTESDLDIMRNGSPKMRFAYYFEKNALSDTLINDKITLTVNMVGTNGLSTNYSLGFDGVQTLTYTFTKDGTYTITYVDNN
jgi:hypothetical protein